MKMGFFTGRSGQLARAHALRTIDSARNTFLMPKISTARRRTFSSARGIISTKVTTSRLDRTGIVSLRGPVNVDRYEPLVKAASAMVAQTAALRVPGWAIEVLEVPGTAHAALSVEG